MASSMEIRTIPKAALFDLLMLKKQMENNNEKDSEGYRGLLQLIKKAKVMIEQEDVAYVEKMINED
ncbi:MAG: hypothetical protein FWE74_02585 [Oscillospiraceae bacterium]|nr:hypothetical protein [Oscillospiraceae bacterium]